MQKKEMYYSNNKHVLTRIVCLSFSTDPVCLSLVCRTRRTGACTFRSTCHGNTSMCFSPLPSWWVSVSTSSSDPTTHPTSGEFLSCLILHQLVADVQTVATKLILSMTLYTVYENIVFVQSSSLLQTWQQYYEQQIL